MLRTINKLLKNGSLAMDRKMINQNMEAIVKRFENLTLRNSQKEMQVMAAKKSKSIF